MSEYPQTAVERAMKIQEVILRALAKRITWWQAAEIIGISDRSMRRWRQRYEKHGYDGLFDRRRGKPGPRRAPLKQVEKVLGLYRDQYSDLNVRHFHQKLREEHGIKLSYSWVKLALQGAGLVKKGCKRGVLQRSGQPFLRDRSLATKSGHLDVLRTFVCSDRLFRLCQGLRPSRFRRSPADLLLSCQANLA